MVTISISAETHHLLSQLRDYFVRSTGKTADNFSDDAIIALLGSSFFDLQQQSATPQVSRGCCDSKKCCQHS